MSDAAACLILTLAAENAQLRQQLASAQDMLVETAIDAGGMHARLDELQAELAGVRAERDAWMAEATRRTSSALRTA